MPARPRTAAKAAAKVRFPTWDEMVAEANLDSGAYMLPMPDGSEIEIPVFDGDQYLAIVQAQRNGDANGLFELIFPDAGDRTRLRTAMKGVHFNILDVMVSKILRYFYGLPLDTPTYPAAVGEVPETDAGDDSGNELAS